ncbi:hypothetical protein D3C85_1893080 [compost metagenome]
MEGDSKIDERLSIMESQRDAVIKQMEEMQEMLDMLNYKCWYYEVAKKAGTCSIHDNIETENVPKEYHKFIT